MNPLIIFEIRNQIINRVDTFKIVSDSRNYLHAKFNFITDDWTGTKTAIFGGQGGANVILDDNNECIVPWKWLASTGRKPVSVFAGDRNTTNTAMCEIRPSGYTEQDAPEPPTPDVYAQLLDKYDEVKDSVPTELSQLESDSNHRTVSDEEKESWNSKSDFSGNYDDLNNKPKIPEEYDDTEIRKDVGEIKQDLEHFGQV